MQLHGRPIPLPAQLPPIIASPVPSDGEPHSWQPWGWQLRSQRYYLGEVEGDHASRPHLRHFSWAPAPTSPAVLSGAIPPHLIKE